MTDAPFPEKFFNGKVETASRLLFWVGLAMTVLGIAAVVFPIVSTLVATLMVGWMLLFFGIILLVGSFSIHGAGPFFGALVAALLAIAAGVFLLVNPGAGAEVLTLVVAVLFTLQGAFEIAFAFDMRRFRGWGWLLTSGIIGVALAVLIAATWPGISLVVLGILFGVNFASTGIAYMLISHELKQVA
jgi:uncharacterized membrane protein HdeD (DUF308 family)